METTQEKLYCQYREDVCPITREYPVGNGLFFAYPSRPETSAEAIKGAIELLSKDHSVSVGLIDWKDLPIEGNIIFCEICEAIRKSSCVVLNTTYVNFNVMFEYGYAIGACRAIWPLVEEGVSKENRIYTTVETLTTIGYSNFTNSNSIYTKLTKKKPWQRTSKFELPEVLGANPTRVAMSLLYLQSIYDNEPSFRISEALSSIPMGKIIDNPAEIPFRPLSWYLNAIGKSHAVIIHLGNDRTEGYPLHSAKCALVAGMALALGRRLLILGEEVSFKPIDYHDITKSYKSVSQAVEITNEFISPISDIIFDFQKYIKNDIGVIKRPAESKEDILAAIDLGDYAAENEEQALGEYFVETPEFLIALKPTYRVFIGRRGTGKTANFYMILDRLAQDKRNLVCNIKPEPWQLDELLEFVKNELDAAKKGYLLQSLWKFMVYSEVIKTCFERIQEKPVYASLSACERAIKDYVENREDISQMSFTSRLINTVRYIYKEFDKEKTAEIAISEILHERIISQMQKLILDYMQETKGDCAIIIDSLDANWKLSRDYKIMAEILLSLIETTQDMWRACSKDIKERSIERGLSLLIFLRTDIFKAVLEVAREPDKLHYELISWKNINTLLEVVNRRIITSLADYNIDVSNWKEILEPGFTPAGMRLFVTENVLFRPRDFIFFIQRCFYHARLRYANCLSKQDFEDAMVEYSEHAFKSLCVESQPYISDMERLLYEFAGGNKVLTLEAVTEKLQGGHIAKKDIRKTIDFLIESNFLGFQMEDGNFHFPITPTDFSIISQKVWKRRGIMQKPKYFRIHNAFHNALLIEP